MNRMHLAQLIEFFKNQNLDATVNFFEACTKDPVTVEGWIEANFVKNHVTARRDSTYIWRDIQANVTTAICCQN